jgi:uncharacterized delta-60 repeat protein
VRRIAALVLALWSIAGALGACGNELSHNAQSPLDGMGDPDAQVLDARGGVATDVSLPDTGAEDGSMVDGGSPDATPLVCPPTPPGVRDMSFGDAGLFAPAINPLTDHSEGHRLANDIDGRHVFVAGEYAPSQWSVFRFDERGVLDSTFGNAGVARIAGQSVHGLAVQSDGKILITGTYAGTPSLVDGSVVQEFSIEVARLLPSGLPDPGFGQNGIVRTIVTSHDEATGGLVVLPDGRIVVAAVGRRVDGSSRPEVIRYLPDGALDSTFGVGGITRLEDVAGQPVFVRVGTDGKILIVGSYYVIADVAMGKIGISRLLSDGTIDTSFAGTGSILHDFGTATKHSALSAALDAQGRIVVAGYEDTGAFGAFVWDFEVSRFLASGAVDTSFGAQGRTTTDFDGRMDWGTSIAIAPSGTITLSGTSQKLPTSPTTLATWAIARYSANGGLEAKETLSVGGPYARASGSLHGPCGLLITGGVPNEIPNEAHPRLGVVRIGE